MSGRLQRKPVMMGLVLLLCTMSGHLGESAHTLAPSSSSTSTTASRDDKNLLLRRIADMVRHTVDASRGPNSADRDKVSSPSSSSSSSSSSSTSYRSVEPRDLRNHKADRGDKIIEIFPRDLRKKEKFLKHLTGPLYFSPKCRKHVYRLYHNTRDCTLPACKFCNHAETSKDVRGFSRGWRAARGAQRVNRRKVQAKPELSRRKNPDKKCLGQ